MRHHFILAVLAIFFPLLAYSQNQIPVNLYTGSPDVRVSLGSIGGHGLSDNIYLVYDATGIAVTARNGYFGLGWNLSAGGTITREVRGLPDDFQGSGSDPRRGWLYDQNNVTTGSFSNSSDNTTATCADEITDYTYINSLGYTKDTEPDIFRYSIPGYSGSFVFDNSTTPSIHLIPYADIKIEPRFVLNTKTIEGFKITTNDGNLFIFNTSSTEERSTTPFNSTTTVEFKKTEFELYRKGSITPAVVYKYEWNLDSIKAPNKGYLYYTYSSVSEEDYRYLPEGNLMLSSYKYSVSATHFDKKLKEIVSSSGTKVSFSYSNLSGGSFKKGKYSLLSSVVYRDARRVDDASYYKLYSILYDYYFPCPVGCDEYVGENGETEGTFNRAFVKSITEKSTCSELAPYEFSYITPRKFPLPIETDVDAWGYYNRRLPLEASKIYIYPQLPPHEQYRIFPIANYVGEKYELPGQSYVSFFPQEDSTKIGILRTIKFPSGGSATLDFELHEFYDSIAQETYKAGGLRIKKITYSDGIDALRDIVTNYSYKNSSDVSSGRLLVQPKYIIPTDKYLQSSNPVVYKSYQELVQQGSNPWTYLARRSYIDLSKKEGDMQYIAYTMAKVWRTGQGYSITEFLLPATWQKSASGEWVASTIKVARSSACNTVDFVKTGSFNIYPYAPNPIYSYSQGLILSSRKYSEQGVLVSETSNKYQNLHKSNNTAFKVWGLTYEKIPYRTDGYLFSKYFLLTDVDKVLASQTTKEYDALNTSKFVTTVQSYAYESTTHKLLSKVQQTNSDGSKYITRYKYPLDFGTISPAASEAALMIKKLQENFRNGTPLETYTTVTPVGGTEKTIAASMSILGAFGASDPLPKYLLALKPVEISNFAPSFIQSNQLVLDSRYDTVNTVLSYLPYFIPSTAKGDDRITRGSVTGYNYTTSVADIANATPDQVAFSDFETTTIRSFDVVGTLVNGTPRSGYKSIHPTVTLSKVIKKGNDKYFISGWILKRKASVINLYVKNVGKTQTYHNQVINFAVGSSTFEYFEYSFPIDASLTDFVVEIQCSVPNAPSDPNQMPLLDDIAVYPVSAEINTKTYLHPYGITSTTNRDQTVYIVYDDLGRIQLKKDKDGNIREKNTYYYPGMSAPVFKAFFTSPTSIPLLQPTTFLVESQACLDGVTYQWDFGQGYVTGSQLMTYAFNSLGSKTVKLKITHPQEGIREYQRTIEVTIPSEQTAYFTNSPPVAGVAITFTARDNSSLGSNVVYEWNFGQGYTVGTREMTYTYTLPATQIVSLRVSSNNGSIPAQVYSTRIIVESPM